MKEGPDIAIVASVIGDPARANMLLALMSGQALTAAELAREAGVTPSTATGHLAKLKAAGILAGRRQGRHHYFQIADPDIGHAVEALMAVAQRAGHIRVRPGPNDEAMRRSRSCYDHLAGRLAVELVGHWLAGGALSFRDGSLQLTRKGWDFLDGRGMALAGLEGSKRPLCRTCMDWSERRQHLGGSLGAAILAHVLAQGWARRQPGQRTIAFSRPGEESFVRWYTLSPLPLSLTPGDKRGKALAPAG